MEARCRGATRCTQRRGIVDDRCADSGVSRRNFSGSATAILNEELESPAFKRELKMAVSEELVSCVGQGGREALGTIAAHVYVPAAVICRKRPRDYGGSDAHLPGAVKAPFLAGVEGGRAAIRDSD